MALRDTGSLLVGLVLLFHTWGAWAEVVVSMEDRVEVSLGQTAQITCMFTSDDGIGGTTIQWSYLTRSGQNQRIYHQDSLMTNVDPGTPYTDRISVNSTGDIVLSIRDVQLEDNAVEFVCLVSSLTDGSAEGRTKLLVFEAPNLPTIEGVQTGISVNEDHPSVIGTCEVKNGYPKPNITWYRGNTPLRSIPDEVNVVSSITVDSSGLYSVKSELNMKVEKEDKDAQFYCEVTYFVPGGMSMTETSRINITVYYPSTAVNIWVESPKGQIKEGDTIELHCSGNGNPETAIYTIKHLLDGTTWETNMLVLENVTRQNSGVYECTSMDMDTVEELSKNTSLFVHYLGRANVIPEKNMVNQGEDLNATCNAVASLPTETTWFKDQKVVASGHILTLQNATFDKAGTYMCKVTVPDIEGMETSGTLRVYVQGPPEIMGKKFKGIETFESTIDLSCNVRGFPVPIITWTTDGKDISTSPQTETEEGAESVVSVKVTSDMTVVCNASNDYGYNTVTFSIKAITHTTTTATNTTATTTTTISTTISHVPVKTATPIPPEKIKKEGNGVIIAIIIICILLLAVLGSVLYFFYKKGKLCGRSGKQDLTKEKSNKDNIVVEMKSDNTEEAILLGVNGEKQPPNDQ